MIENLWRIDGQREGAKVIYEEAQKLVDKLGGFIETVNSLGHSIELSQKKFDDAMNKLSTGKDPLKQGKQINFNWQKRIRENRA